MMVDDLIGIGAAGCTIAKIIGRFSSLITQIKQLKHLVALLLVLTSLGVEITNHNFDGPSL
jgi:hypothetical protein